MSDVTVYGALSVGGPYIKVTSNTSPAAAALTYDGLNITDASGMGEWFTPITVTIDGTQYKVLGHKV